MEPCVRGGLKIYTNGHGPLIKMAAMPIYGKTVKNLLLQNQESFGAESWYIASRIQGLETYSNDDCKWTVDLFKARSN